jgi:hypothetical protein
MPSVPADKSSPDANHSSEPCLLLPSVAMNLITEILKADLHVLPASVSRLNYPAWRKPSAVHYCTQPISENAVRAASFSVF